MTLSGTVNLCAVSALCVLALARKLLTHPYKMCCHFCEMYLSDDNCRTNHVTPVHILANLCVPFGCRNSLRLYLMTGMEFLEPRMGFFCQVCAKFYSEDEEAKESHCRSVKHYENLEVG